MSYFLLVDSRCPNLTSCFMTNVTSGYGTSDSTHRKVSSGSIGYQCRIKEGSVTRFVVLITLKKVQREGVGGVGIESVGYKGT